MCPFGFTAFLGRRHTAFRGFLFVIEEIRFVQVPIVWYSGFETDGTGSEIVPSHEDRTFLQREPMMFDQKIRETRRRVR